MAGPLTLRVDDETRDRWQAAADDAGYSLSEYVRACVEANAGGGVAAPTRTPEARTGPQVVPERHRGRVPVPLDRREVTPYPKPTSKAKPRK